MSIPYIEIPVGTHQESPGMLATVSEAYFIVRTNGKHRERFVDCICDCGSKKTTSASNFKSLLVKSCGCFYEKRSNIYRGAIHLNHKGPNHKRGPSCYTQALQEIQGNNCAWCKEKFIPGKRVHVDHDHRCCPEIGLCCAYCPRGLVHAYCNNNIATLERYRDEIILSERMIDYLDTRRHIPLDSYNRYTKKRGK